MFYFLLFGLSGQYGLEEEGSEHSKENDVEKQTAELGILHYLLTSLSNIYSPP